MVVMAMEALVEGLSSGKWMPFFFCPQTGSGHRVLIVKAKNFNKMFTTTPVLLSEVKKAELVNELCRDLDTLQATQTLEELFFTWIGSENADETDSETRARIAYHFRTIAKFLNQASKVYSGMEVTND